MGMCPSRRPIWSSPRRRAPRRACQPRALSPGDLQPLMTSGRPRDADRVRTIAALVVAAHGIGFTLWFLAAWVPAVKPGRGYEGRMSGSHLVFSRDLPVTGELGKATGLLSLLLMAGFLVTAWGIFTETAWWEPVAIITSLVSLVAVVIPWWTTVMPFNAIGATVVDLLLIGCATIPALHDRLIPT